MTREECCARIEEAIAMFPFEGEQIRYELYGQGHINDTFLITRSGGKRYILQRMNHEIFKKPEELMENIAGITEFLRKKIEKRGGDVLRETMNIIKTVDGKDYYRDAIGSYWRAYVFIEGATTYELVRTPEDFYQSALGFGRFQNLLQDYPAETLHETIVDFHNTPVRFANFQKAVLEDVCGRAKDVTDEIAFVQARQEDCNVLTDLLKEKKIPLRVTHNDTKLNNIMIDDSTNQAICVIDLDTVMPGLSVNDFGDSIRFGATTGAEDERDLSKVNLDVGLFETYTKGFLEGCSGSLTNMELEMLPMGAKTMTLECGMRFLMDYLQGDIYFRIHRDGHNLDRARTQFKLVQDMEKHWNELHKIVNKYREK